MGDLAMVLKDVNLYAKAFEALKGKTLIVPCQ